MRNVRRIEVQISARVKKPKGHEITGNLLREAIAYRLSEGSDPPGIELRIIGWQKGNYQRTADDSGKSQSELWEQFTPLLRARLLDDQTIRTRQRTRARV
jgi:hypothetical protein